MNKIKKEIKDILDSKGQNNNFITNKAYSKEYIRLAEKWSILPMYEDKKSIEKFFNLVNDNQVVLLISGTGSGKTVLVPKFLLKYFKTINKDKQPKIAITNPKTLTTVYNAEYSANTLDVKLGEEVGYKFKGSPSEFISDKSELVYVTDGLLLAKILNGDKKLDEYNAIIIDEAHERGIQIDLLLKFIKEFLPERPDFKLIIMSATINAEIFKKYFNKKPIKYGEIEVSGKTNFPIRQIWLDNKTKVNRSNYIEIAVQKCIDIISHNDNFEGRDILVFIATSNDALKGCELLKQECPKNIKIKNKSVCNEIYCVEVFSKMKQENKELAVSKDIYKQKYPEKKIKIIFATNIAESSITFDGLVYVIDSGFELVKYYEPLSYTNVINKVMTTQAQIKQRIGRAGRTRPGIAYHLYTEHDFNKLEKYPAPSILVSDLTEYILSFIKYSTTLDKTIQIIKDLITPPSNAQINSAINKLVFINAIKLVDKDDNKIYLDKINKNDILKYNGAITTLGYILLRFRSVLVLNALAIIMGYYMNCQSEIIKIIALMEESDGNIDKLFIFKNKEKNDFIKFMSKYSINNSEHLTILNIYNNYYAINKINNNNNDQSNIITYNNDNNDQSNIITYNNDNNDFNGGGGIQYINAKKFYKIDNRIKELTKYAKSINEEKYKYINDKYNIIKIKDYEDDNIKIIYTLAEAFNFNSLSKGQKNMYKSKYYIDNIEAPLEFSIITKENNDNKNAFCQELNNTFGKKHFNLITKF